MYNASLAGGEHFAGTAWTHGTDLQTFGEHMQLQRTDDGDSAREPCFICGGQTRKTVLEKVPDYVSGTPGEWDLVACQGCGVVLTEPPVPPDQIGPYYAANYSPFTVDPLKQRGRFKTLLRETMMFPYRLRFGSDARDREPFGGARVLEVGCGSGTLLAALARRGWQCHCLDPSEAALERARSAAPNGSFFRGTLEEFTSELKFDLIILSHVLEHLAEPRTALLKLGGMLASGGRLQIEVPNIAGAEARLFGRNWRGLDLPRHYVHFTPDSLRRLLKETGFVVDSQRTAFLASSIVESLQTALARLFSRETRSSRLLYFALTPVASLSYLLGNVGAVEVVARAAQEPS